MDLSLIQLLVGLTIKKMINASPKNYCFKIVGNVRDLDRRLLEWVKAKCKYYKSKAYL